MRTVLHTANLKAALTCTANERTRYAFDGIRVDADGRIVATDGKALFRALGLEKDPETTRCGTNGFPADNPEPVLLPIAQVASIVKNALDPDVVLTNGKNSYQIRLATELSEETTAEGEGIQGGFPNFDPMFDAAALARADGHVARVTFSVEQLEKVLKAAKAYGKDTVIDLEPRLVDSKGDPEEPGNVATYFELRAGAVGEAAKLADGFVMPLTTD